MSDSDDDDNSRSRFKISKTNQLIQQLEMKIQNYQQDTSKSLQFSNPQIDIFDFEQKMKKLESSYSQSPQASPTKMDQVVQQLSKKLEIIEDDRNAAYKMKLEHQLKQQKQGEQEQNLLMRESQKLKFEFESLLRTLEFEEQKQLSEQRQLIHREQEEKLMDIQDQSERLIQEEEIKKSNFLLELQQLQFEKNQLQSELNQLQKEQEMLSSHRDDVSNQLSNLMQLHNQMLQNDLKKKIVHMEENSDTIHSSLKPDQIDNLYQLNQQLHQSMNQQLSLIRQELNEQKQINLDLLQLLNHDQQVLNQEKQTPTDLVYNEESNIEKENKENLIQEESQESDTILQQKYVNDDKIKSDFDQLFEKHKKIYFKKPNFNYQKPLNRNSNQTTVSKMRKSVNQSKSKSKEKKAVQSTFEQSYKKHINEQLKKLNQIVTKSLKQ